MPLRPYLRRIRCLYACLYACLLPLPLLASVPAWASPEYAINFLPAGFRPAQINDTGQIVGTYQNAAAILANGSIASLGGQFPNSVGAAIDNAGNVAGTYFDQGTAFARIGGTALAIGATLPENYPFSDAHGINGAGVVVGNALPFIGEAARGYVYQDGTARLIGTFGGEWSNAFAVNASGAVVGTAALVPTESPFNSDRHAFIDRDGTLYDLGTLGGLRSEAYDINAAGLVVGWSETNVDPDNGALSRPFLYRGGTMFDLGSLGGNYGYARALNDAGVIVGESDIVTDVGWGSHAFLYKDGTMLDLNALVTGANGWEIVDATDINNAGQVLARACRLGTCADVRLDLVPAVPEPGAWASLLAGLTLLGWRVRRRPRAQAGRRLPVPAQLLALLALPLGGAALAAPAYTVTLLDGNNVDGYAIAADGSIAGSGANADGDVRSFVWKDGNTTFLPTLGGNYAYATAISGGIVAGTSVSGDFNRGFVYANGTIERIGTLYGGDSYAYGVNAAGQVVGESTDAGGNSRAFLYSGGTLTDLGTLGGTDARARAINGSGMIVGGSYLGPDRPDQGAHAFSYRDGTMSDLGTLGGGFSWANAVNDAGQVAGFSLVGTDAVQHPFLYSDGVMHDLGSLGGDYGTATGINAAGVVVGTTSLPGGGFSHAFVYADGSLQDLNGLVDGLGIFVLTNAVGINDAGQIVANGCTEFGYCTAALLTPVPEPAPAWLLLAGMPVLLWGRRRGPRCGRPDLLHGR